jgi:hypothetical protein
MVTLVGGPLDGWLVLLHRHLCRRASGSAIELGWMDLFTVGYEGRSLPQLIRMLEKHGLRRLIDVRERPYVSDRPPVSNRSDGRQSNQSAWM